MMDNNSIVDLLARTALFGSLDQQDRAAIVARMRRVQFEPDQMIFSRGDPGRDLYLVLEGRIRLSVLSSEGRELSFDHAGPGHVFGEIATLDGGERTAGATAIGRVQAMALRQWQRMKSMYAGSLALKLMPGAVMGPGGMSGFASQRDMLPRRMATDYIRRQRGAYPGAQKKK